MRLRTERIYFISKDTLDFIQAMHRLSSVGLQFFCKYFSWDCVQTLEELEGKDTFKFFSKIETHSLDSIESDKSLKQFGLNLVIFSFTFASQTK